MNSLTRGRDNFQSLFESLTGFALPTSQSIINQCIPLEGILGSAGVYFLIKEKSIVYIGQSITPEARIITHAREKDFDSFYIIRCQPEKLNAAESLLIAHFQPVLNGNVTNPPEGLCLKLQAKTILKRDYGLHLSSFNKWRKMGWIQPVVRYRKQEFFWTHEVIQCAEAHAGQLSAFGGR